MSTHLSSTKVLITGANGFIGLHTILRCLQLGYCVRATVRTEAHEKNVGATLSGHVNTSRLEFARADLFRADGWQKAVQGCEFVIHTAAPFPVENPKDENELVIPARDGTLHVLRAAQAGGIKRVVLLSTSGAIYDGHQGENRTFDENDWTDLAKCTSTYLKGKTLAERAGWDFILSAENQSRMEMVAINPSNVFGPVLDSHFHTSLEWFRTLMKAEIPGVPRMLLPLVDVRDLADILARAITVPEAAGKRFICNAATIPLSEFADILDENFASRGYRIPKRVLPDLLFHFLALFNPKVRAVAANLDWQYSLSTEQARSVFGWQPLPYKQTILDMAESLIEHSLA